jgi:zinc transport system ATP-binding protein
MLISAEAVSVSYGGAEVLRRVDFGIEAGEIVTVVGPNGSGKSTLLRALLGAVPLAAGRVVRRPGLRLGYVPQKLAVDAAMPITVARFLSLPARRSAADPGAAPGA